MNLTASGIWASVQDIRKRAPVVHNITNYVVMNNSANALLSLGASPVMAHADQEVEDMVDIAGALVINIGTLSPHWIKAMLRAARHAKKRNIPIVLDPVGAGATPYRTNTTKELLNEVPPSIIRGNASEIMAILEEEIKTKGVDSTASSQTAVDIARRLNEIYGSVVCVSGETDFIIDKRGIITVMNGHPMMTKVTGMGCIASAFCGAFAAVNKDFAMAAGEAMAVMGIAGEIAAEGANGPGSLQLKFYDVLYNLKEEDIKLRLQTDKV